MNTVTTKTNAFLNRFHLDLARVLVVGLVAFLLATAAYGHFVRQTGPRGVWSWGYGYGYGLGYGIDNDSYRECSGDCDQYLYGYGYGFRGSGRRAPGYTITSTPTPSPTTSPTTSPEPSRPPLPSEHGLVEGNLIRLIGGLDVYVINQFGYLRMFINETVFSFYGHLGGFPAVQEVDQDTIDWYPRSPYVRNCEPPPDGQEEVYALEFTGADTGVLHHIDMTGEEAFAEDPFFFLKIFCINTLEFNTYSIGAPYTALSQVP